MIYPLVDYSGDQKKTKAVDVLNKGNKTHFQMKVHFFIIW